MRHRTRRGRLSPKRQRLLDICHEQECITNVLCFGVGKLLELGYPSTIDFRVAKAQINEAELHAKEADRLYNLVWHPRSQKRGRGKK